MPPTRRKREGDRYIAEFNAKFKVAATEKGTAFRHCSRSDLNWVFTVQTERVVAKDNTVAIGPRSWQLSKTRFRYTLTGSTVTIHEHLDGIVSIRYGPHVVGQFSVDGSVIRTTDQKRRGKGASRADDDGLCFQERKSKSQTQGEGGLTATSLCFTKRTDRVLTEPDILTC